MVRVMTYNILHDAVRNLNEPWPVRRPAVVATIRSADPDVIGLQEVSQRQLEHLRIDLPEYELIPGAMTGLTRLPFGFAALARSVLGDFLDRGEFCPILVRRDRFTCLENASVMLSFSRDGLGPAWADPPTPHLVTWARVETGEGPSFTFHNTHLGILPWNWSRTARELLIVLGREWNGEPQVLVGDFNAPPAGPLLRLLKTGSGDPAKAFHDTWDVSGSREGWGWTYHWGGGWRGLRLDYILVRPTVDVGMVATTGERVGGIYPSDHFAIVADLNLPRGKLLRT